MDKETFLVNKQMPKRPIKLWQVRIGCVVYYENELYSLCHHYKTTNSLTRAEIKAKY